MGCLEDIIEIDPNMTSFLNLSPRPYMLSDLCITCAWFTIYVPLHFLLLFRWVTQRPEWPEWTFSTYLMVNRCRIRNTMKFWRRLPPKDFCEETLPTGPFQWFARRYQCSINQIECPPLPSTFPRVGPLETARQVVDDRSRVMFIVTANGKIWPSEAALPDERVILYIVGGGYIGGHPLAIHTPYSLANATGARIFCKRNVQHKVDSADITYRKSLDDASAFPGSLIDCLVGYRYLIKQGFLAKVGVIAARKPAELQNIMTCGDSAGGNACLALSRYLGEIERLDGSMGMPGAIVANSVNFIPGQN